MVKRKCKKCDNLIEHPEYPENELCKTCYIKWKEKALKCKECGKVIDWHNFYWHNKQCDDCYDSWKYNKG